MKPQVPLDPNLVKALIGSESGFNLKPELQKTKSAGLARGFIQLTDQAVKILGDTKGPLKKHFVKITQEDTEDPNLSIAAGIRWLFRKKELASHKLGHPANWDEAIADYKGYLNDMISGKNPNPSGMKRIHHLYKELTSED